MPILITATALSLLFKGDKEAPASFLNPAALREKISETVPAGSAHDAALALADELLEFARAYEATTKTVLEKYVAQTTEGSASAESIIEVIAPQDRARSEILSEIIRVRQGLIDVLTPEAWQLLFTG